MILIADSGSTKTDWSFSSQKNDSIFFSTEGINPLFRSQNDITLLLKNIVAPKLPSCPNSIFFYGAGAVSGNYKKQLKEAFLSVWKTANISIESDLYASIYALCPDTQGIVTILGTGMNSCLWDGNKVIQQIPPLGYILGDEGSGAYLGKQFLSKMLRNEFPSEFTEVFFKYYETSYTQIIENIYQQSFPNKHLAAYCDFIYKHLSNPLVEEIVEDSFITLFEKIINQYPKDIPIYLCGSVAFYFQDILKRIADKFDRKIEKCIKKPIKELTVFHQNNKWYNIENTPHSESDLFAT